MQIGQLKVEEKGDTNWLKSYVGVNKLGVCAPPGTKIQINNSGVIEINQYGIYQIDLSDGLGIITSLKVLELEEKSYVLIDFIYQNKEGVKE